MSFRRCLCIVYLFISSILVCNCLYYGDARCTTRSVSGPYCHCCTNTCTATLSCCDSLFLIILTLLQFICLPSISSSACCSSIGCALCILVSKQLKQFTHTHTSKMNGLFHWGLAVLFLFSTLQSKKQLRAMQFNEIQYRMFRNMDTLFELVSASFPILNPVSITAAYGQSTLPQRHTESFRFNEIFCKMTQFSGAREFIHFALQLHCTQLDIRSLSMQITSSLNKFVKQKIPNGRVFCLSLFENGIFEFFELMISDRLNEINY